MEKTAKRRMLRMRQILIALLALCIVPAAWAQGGVAVQTATVTLTPAQIVSLCTSPVQVVAAPGAGQILNPVSFTLQYKFGTTPYTVSPQGIQFISGAPGHDEYGSVSTSNLLDAPSSRVATASANGQVGGDPATYANQPLMVELSTSDASGGDGTLTITVAYTVVALQ
jgi:hypothetical protein